jgi:hypothetical protein
MCIIPYDKLPLDLYKKEYFHLANPYFKMKNKWLHRDAAQIPGMSVCFSSSDKGWPNGSIFFCKGLMGAYGRNYHKEGLHGQEFAFHEKDQMLPNPINVAFFYISIKSGKCKE